LNALDAESRREVDDYLHTDPDARHRVDRLRQLLEPLESDREAPAPPPRLVEMTLARVAEVRSHLLPFAPPSTEKPSGRRSGWRRCDGLVAAAMLLVGLGIAATWLSKVWQRADLVECKENMHRFHTSLVEYADLRDDRAFPRVEEEGPRSFAGVFVPLLADAG